MSGNKYGIPVSPEYVMLFFDNGFPGGRLIISPLTVRVGLQLQPTLVVFIHRVPKGGRVGGMDQHRDVKRSAFFPNSIQPRTIDRDYFSIVVFEFDSQVFIDLSSYRPIMVMRLQLLQRAFRPSFLPQMYK